MRKKNQEVSEEPVGKKFRVIWKNKINVNSKPREVGEEFNEIVCDETKNLVRCKYIEEVKQ